MKSTFVTTAVALALSGCALVQHHSAKTNAYDEPFYAKYLDSANPSDRQIQTDIRTLRTNPASAATHNDLGQLLAVKGFPKDAEREFERAVDSDSHFYPAWYNLGLIRLSHANYAGARFAFGRALHYKPGHPAALFQMGLLEEKRGNEDAATDYYSRAFLINHDMLDVKVNPSLLDSKLIALALIKAYPKEHAREGLVFESAPQAISTRAGLASAVPSPQAPASEIVQPSAPVTDPGTQTPAPNTAPLTAPPPPPRKP